MRISSVSRRNLIVFTMLIMSALMGPAAAQMIEGVVTRVIDGDTFEYENGTKIRLCGINAPERKDAGGSEATAFLTEKIEGKQVTCRVVGGGTPCDGRSSAKSYNRTVAQCYIDIGDIMVEGGHAKDSPRYSGGRYAQK